MCLSLSEDYIKATQRYKNRKGPIRAYKVLTMDKRSTCRNSKWKKGLNKSNREDATLASGEILALKIFKGFHFFLNKDDAFRESNSAFPNNEIVWEVQIQPKDIVAVGTFNRQSSIVTTQAKLTKKARRRPGKKQ